MSAEKIHILLKEKRWSEASAELATDVQNIRVSLVKKELLSDSACT
jgi:hypothetical protein